MTLRDKKPLVILEWMCKEDNLGIENGCKSGMLAWDWMSGCWIESPEVGKAVQGQFIYTNY